MSLRDGVSRAQQWLHDQLAVDMAQSEILLLLVSVVVIFVVMWLAKALFDRVQRQFEKTATPWDDRLVQAARGPLLALIWLLGLSWVVQVLDLHSDSVIMQVVAPIRKMGVILLIGWFLVRLARSIEQALMQSGGIETRLDNTTISALGKLVRLVIIVVLALVALQSFGYSISGVLAFGGIGGIAVGFAAKDLLANFFGGLMIYLDRPFKVGDWIRSPEQPLEGTVEHIGWRLTRIRTFEQRPLYVPNATFTKIAIENPSRMTNRQISETLGLRISDAPQVEQIVSAIQTFLRNDERIDTRQSMVVGLDSFGPESVNIFIYTFTKTTAWADYQAVKQAVLLEILNIIQQHEAQLALPTRQLQLPDWLREQQDRAQQGANPAENKEKSG